MRYPILHFISMVYRVLGILIAIVSVIGSIVLFTQLGSIGDVIDINTGANYGDLVRVTGTTWGVITLIGGIFLSMGMYAVGEFLKLMIDIEHNTRKTRSESSYKMPSLHGSWET